MTPDDPTAAGDCAILIPKAKREVIRLRWEVHHGHTGLNVRIMVVSASGELKPTRKGVWIPVASVEAFATAAASLAAEAGRRGA